MSNPIHTRRLEELRAALRAENISYGELAELQSLAGEIEPGDVELLEAAGVPEFPEDEEESRYWTLDALPSEDTSESNRIHEVTEAAGWPVIGLVDEEAGGVIAYFHPSFEDELLAKLNGKD